MDLLINNQIEYIPYLRDLVSYAKAEIPFYSRFYKQHPDAIKSLDQFTALPHINEGMLIRERLEDMVSDITMVHEVCYPAGKLKSDCCMPRVQSQEDQEDQYLILEWILEECLGVDLKNRSPAMAMLADEENSYWIGVFSKMMILLCNTPFFGIIARNHTPNELYTELTRINPELLIVSGCFDQKVIPESVHTIIQIGENPNFCFSNSNTFFRYCHILSHPLLGLIGCSSNQQNTYMYNPDYYFIENSENGLLVYTSFMQKYMPMIRLRTRHWGKVLQPGFVEITYRGTH